jgi:hypothetical protein
MFSYYFISATFPVIIDLHSYYMYAVRVLLTDGRVRQVSLVSDRNTAQNVYVHRFMSITFFVFLFMRRYTFRFKLILAFSYVLHFAKAPALSVRLPTAKR